MLKVGISRFFTKPFLTRIPNKNPLGKNRQSTSHSDESLSGRPTLGLYESFSDVPASVERNSYVRLGRIRDEYGPKVGRPLNVRVRPAEWVPPPPPGHRESMVLRI